MDDTATLREIEAIKQLKARYCRLLDTKDWQGWRSLFADRRELRGRGRVVHCQRDRR
jgi:hypothetical protein